MNARMGIVEEKLKLEDKPVNDGNGLQRYGFENGVKPW